MKSSKKIMLSMVAGLLMQSEMQSVGLSKADVFAQELHQAVAVLKAKPVKGGYILNGKTYSQKALVDLWQAISQQSINMNPTRDTNPANDIADPDMPTSEPISTEKPIGMPTAHRKLAKKTTKASKPVTEKSLMADIQAIQKERIELISEVADYTANAYATTFKNLPIQQQKTIMEANVSANAIKLLDQLLQEEQEALKNFQKKYAKFTNYSAPSSAYVG